MKIAVLGWDRGAEDPDSPGLAEAGRARGHETSLVTLEEVAYRPGRAGLEVFLGAEPASRFDAVLSRANLYGEWREGDRLYDGWPDRLERLAMLGSVPGLAVFDPVDVWFRGYSKFLTAQCLSAAGLPAPPTRSARTVADVAAAVADWDVAVIKPSFGLRAMDVERIGDAEGQAEVITGMLSRYQTLVCTPFYPTQWGEYRVVVAGDSAPLTMLKLPAAGAWRVKTLEGASFERVEPPADLIELAIASARTMELTLAGLDVLPTAEGWVVLEVNPVAGFFDIFGKDLQREIHDATFAWVEERTQPTG
jgi:ribosomal protein S6--L-glutamate ligase